MDNRYRKIAIISLAVSFLTIVIYYSYLSGWSFSGWSHAFFFRGGWATFLKVSMIVGLPLLFAIWFRNLLLRRWAIAPDLIVTRDKYLIKGGATAMVLSYIALFTPFVVSPLFLVGVVFPKLRGFLLKSGEGFVLLPGNWLLWLMLAAFWIGLGVLSGAFLFKLRTRTNTLRPFGVSGFLLIFLTELLVGVGIFYFARLFL